MKKLLLIISLSLAVVEYAHAQNWYRNYEKYWWYRYRLVNDFMKVGDGPGESIPAYKRKRFFNTGQSVKAGFLNWGDATQALGHYIKVTATEFRILEKNGWQTSRSAMEAYYALNAFERLDKNAESYCADIHGTYPNNPTYQDRNGFFIRDDVPENLVLNNFQHFNRPKIVNVMPVGNPVIINNWEPKLENGFCNDPNQSIWVTVNGGAAGSYFARQSVTSTQWSVRYSSCPPSTAPSPTVTGPPPQYPDEPSQDQLAELMSGFGLASKFLGNASYNGQNLTQKAETNAYNAASWAAQGASPWILKNPLTQHCVYGIVSQHYFIPQGCGDAGGIVIQSSPAIAKATDIIVNGSYNTSWMQATASGFWPIFQFSQLNASGEAMHADNYVAFSRNWFSFFNPFDNKSWKRIKNHALNNDFQTPHIPLIYKLNYPGGGVDFDPTNDGQPSYEALLNCSNFCGNYSYDDLGITKNPGTRWEWSDQDRLSFAFARGNKHNSDFNNVDYMELFNLYSLVKEDYLQWVINPFYHENFDINYPDWQGNGSSTNWLTLNYLEYLSLANQIAANGHVTFRGAKVVDINPGFNTALGGVFTAYVEDYDCTYDNSTAYHYALLGAPHNAIPFEYNPTGLPYVAKMTGGTNEIDYSIEDSIAESMINDDLENVGRDSLIRTIEKSGYYDIAKELFPELFSDEKNSNPIIGIDGISVYPNPNGGEFYVSFSNPGEYTIRVFDLVGKMIYTTTNNGRQKVQLKLDGISQGNYIVDVRSAAANHVEKITIIN